MTGDRELSIIVVNWNSLEYLRECLRSIYSNTPEADFEIIVIDNASSRDEAAEVKREFPEVVSIRSEVNLGFAAANNLAYERSTGRNLLFLNPDTEVLGSAITIMLECLRTASSAGAIGCRLLNGDGTVQTSCVQRFPSIVNQLLDVEVLRLRWPKSRLWGIGVLFSNSVAPFPVEMISGACLMIKRDCFIDAGLFCTDYFMYAEDADLCYQIHKHGRQVYYVGNASVVHHGGGSSRKVDQSEWVAVMQRQAALTFCEKAHGRLYAWAFRVAIGFNACMRLGILVALSPFKERQSHKRAIASTPRKWIAVMKWAIGLYSAAK